jgi:hypothetical protein
MRKHDLIGAEYNILRILRGNDETLSPDEIASRMIVRPLNPKAILAGLKGRNSPPAPKSSLSDNDLRRLQLARMAPLA